MCKVKKRKLLAVGGWRSVTKKNARGKSLKQLKLIMVAELSNKYGVVFNFVANAMFISDSA